MEPEFVIAALLAIVGAALIAGGVVLVVRSKGTAGKAWGAAAIAAGVVMWAIVLFTTTVSRSTGG